MSTFKFVGNNRYFNGICTNDLVFDNKDSSEKRLFCEESTCVSAKYSGIMPITACRTEMLPNGYRDKIFEWGVEGGPWTTTINYGGRFPSSPNEFVGPGTLGNVKPPVDPNGNFYYYYTFNGRTNLVFNSNAFSNSFSPENSAPNGYTALGGGQQFTIDPESSLGTNSYEPTRDENNRCSVSALRYNEPTISYYDVGVNPTLPQKHDVVFPKAFLSVSDRPGVGPWLDPTSSWMFTPPPPSAVTFRDTYINPAMATAAANGSKCPYSAGNHPAMPALSAFPEWNYDHVTVNNVGTYVTGRSAINSRGACVYHPLADYHDSAKVIRGTTAGPEWHTGYRMQRYTQTVCGARLGAYGNNSYISFGFRDIETRIKAYGYYAKWTIKSIVPTYFIIQNSVYNQGSPGFPAGLYHSWGVEAVVTIEVTYHPFNSTVHPVYNYEYGATPSSSDPYYCGNAPSDYGGWNPPFTRKALYAVNNCAPFQPTQVTAGDHFVYGYVNFNILGTKTWATQQSHSPTTPVSSDASNPLSLQSTKRINYYTLPMSWNTNYSTYGTGYISPTVDSTYIAYQSQKFTNAYARPSTGIITTSYPSLPNNFKIWRRKV